MSEGLSALAVVVVKIFSVSLSSPSSWIWHRFLVVDLVDGQKALWPSPPCFNSGVSQDGLAILRTQADFFAEERYAHRKLIGARRRHRCGNRIP